MFRRILNKIQQLSRVIQAADARLAVLNRDPVLRVLEALRRDTILSLPRYRDPLRLPAYGYAVYSQVDEDGILAEVFRRVGDPGRTFCEIGAGDGLENNTAYLLAQGWSGSWVEGDPKHAEAIRSTFSRSLALGELLLRQALVTAENAGEVLAGLAVPSEPDLFSLDIDGNDWHVWRSLRFRPRVCVLEYNAAWGPSLDWVMPYDPGHRFARSRYYGASLKAYERLGREKGYSLVGCNYNGTNAFFVRDDQIRPGVFGEPFTSENHYEPPRHLKHGRFGWPKDRREPCTFPGAKGIPTR